MTDSTKTDQSRVTEIREIREIRSLLYTLQTLDEDLERVRTIPDSAGAHGLLGKALVSFPEATHQFLCECYRGQRSELMAALRDLGLDLEKEPSDDR